MPPGKIRTQCALGPPSHDLGGIGPPVERILVAGSAAQALLDAAKEADLVAHHAPCPVVIVPHQE